MTLWNWKTVRLFVVIPIHRVSGNKPLTSVPTQLIMDMDSWTLGLGLKQIAGCSSILAPRVEGSFVEELGRPDLVPGANYFRRSICTPFSLTGKIAWFGESCVTVRTFKQFGNFLEIFYQKGMSAVNSSHNGFGFLLLFRKFWAEMSPQSKHSLVRHPEDSDILPEITGNQRQMLHFYRLVWNFIYGKEFFGQFPCFT